MEQEGLNVGYLAYNTTAGALRQCQGAQGAEHGDQQAGDPRRGLPGRRQGAKNPIPPTMWSYNDDIEDDPYDPEAAKKMLEEAGVKDLKMKVWAMPVQRPYNPDARRMAELIQADFAAVGVEVEIVSYEWGEYLERSKAKDRDGAVLLGWTGDNGDPDNFLAVLLGCDAVGGANRAQWCNQPFEDLIQKAKILPTEPSAPGSTKRRRCLQGEAPWATIAHSVVFMPMSKKVMNYKMDPLGSHRFDGVDIAE
jgi:dipeptide transport system substrate-binding protein